MFVLLLSWANTTMGLTSLKNSTYSSVKLLEIQDLDT